jgi:hypothetical protein
MQLRRGDSEAARTTARCAHRGHSTRTWSRNVRGSGNVAIRRLSRFRFRLPAAVLRLPPSSTAQHKATAYGSLSVRHASSRRHRGLCATCSRPWRLVARFPADLTEVCECIAPPPCSPLVLSAAAMGFGGAALNPALQYALLQLPEHDAPSIASADPTPDCGPRQWARSPGAPLLLSPGRSGLRAARRAAPHASEEQLAEISDYARPRPTSTPRGQTPKAAAAKERDRRRQSVARRPTSPQCSRLFG